MSKHPYSPPTLCIDLKRNRIRIHKTTLHMLGDPSYIQLLVNPQSGLIAIRRSSSVDHYKHRIRPQFFTSDNCYELTSKLLLDNICSLFDDFDKSHSYRIRGTFIPKECIAQFALKDSVPIADSEYSESRSDHE